LRSDVEVRERAGEGLLLKQGEHTYRLGHPRFALAQTEPGETPQEPSVLLSCDGVELARFVLREELCRDAQAEIGALRSLGYQLFMLSGDRKDKVARIAKELGITEAHAELTPEQKCALVQQIDGNARDTLMIGDGINDALAFSAAACAGTPAIDRPTLPARADFYFAGVGIGPISETLQLARKLRRIIVRNLALASVYNLIVLGLSFAGLMTPLRCALAMPISSLLMIAVTVSSFREESVLRGPTPRPASAPASSPPPSPGSPSSLALASGVSS
jgi:Cu2+-exporting ATPase